MPILRRTVSFSFLFILTASIAAAANQDLCRLYQGKTVTAHLEVRDSAQGKVDPEMLKAKLLQGLKERKSICFDMVDDPSAAELDITADILDYHWTDHDPVDMLVGVGAAAIDSAKIEDYARMTVDTAVKDRSGRQVWRDKLSATMTKKPMSQAESIPLVTDKFVKVFIREVFGKKSGR